MLLLGLRVVVPPLLQSKILALLHESHPGCTRCKQLAQSYVLMPGIDADIERVVQSCQSCAEQRREANTPVLGRWEYPSTALHRMHIDHAGPFLGHYWLVWVDEYSNFGCVHRVSGHDASRSVNKLREVFAYFGLPNQIVSDNGPAFIGDEFQQFMRTNGVQHIRSAPFHSQTNGEAERFVQTFKRAMDADDRHVTDDELDRRMQQILLKYRVTPDATTGRTPAEVISKSQANYCIR